MVPERSRRSLLTGAGVALLTGLAGCSSGGSDGGDTSTVGGRTYSIEVRNDITTGDLEAMPYRIDEDATPTNGSQFATTKYPTDAPAKIRVEAARSIMHEEDPTLFEKDLELAPGTSRTFRDAFATEPGGDTYVVVAEMEPFLEYEGGPPPDHFRQYRFTPGEFNTPDDDTFLVRAYDEDPGKTLDPAFELK